MSALVIIQSIMLGRCLSGTAAMSSSRDRMPRRRKRMGLGRPSPSRITSGSLARGRYWGENPAPSPTDCDQQLISLPVWPESNLQPDRYERPNVGQPRLSPAIFVRAQLLSLRFVHALSGAVLRILPEGPKSAIGSVWWRKPSDDLANCRRVQEQTKSAMIALTIGLCGDPGWSQI